MWVGVGMLVFIAPLAFVFKRSPESIGVGPDGDPLKESKSHDKNSQGEIQDSEDEWTAKQAIRTRAFWTLALGTLLRIFCQYP